MSPKLDLRELRSPPRLQLGRSQRSLSTSNLWVSSPIPTTSDALSMQPPPLVLSPPTRPGSYTIDRRVLFCISCVLTTLCSGGLILGFGPFYTTLVAEQQWHELCDSPGVCPEQEIRLQYTYSTSFLLLSAANVVFGLSIDIIGPRVSALLGLLLAMLGNVLVSVGDSSVLNGAGIIVGYGLIGMGGMGLFLSSFQVINLFDAQGIPCSIMSSIFNISAYVYMLLKLPGMTRHHFFEGYAILVAICFCVCFLIYPAKNIHSAKERVRVPGVSCYIPRPRKPTLLFEGLQRTLQSGDLWHFAFFFGWLSLVFSFTGGAIPSMIAKTAGTDVAKADVYINYVFPLVSNSTFLFAPIVGHCIDTVGFRRVFGGCLLLTQLFLLTLLVPVLEVQLLGFLFMSIAQSSLYSLQFAYIMICYPTRLYGTLQAFITAASFLLCSLNYGINTIAQTYLGGDYTCILLFLGAPTVLLYACQHFVRENIEDEECHLVYEDDAMSPLPRYA
ncbi:hypothetical protein, variant [Saprolegnia diclina VS20]|uniref:Major facilitator superfamily (MFS) profile domain-containing protein n=1 Tax=Saprolegnia diclina (strain VS20) TaxID=1156394 RepID=T0QE18_SAPDV|nr:hypothetical protein, variant [Saprolegnia diclina VS20]EQC31820.1 hypothetical protein, variant [Saprolegnia diclina VS20]|eukprot:XP_008614827.1 hypothetical protein, variant [Saprolegnia diclina VS20]